MHIWTHAWKVGLQEERGEEIAFIMFSYLLMLHLRNYWKELGDFDVQVTVRRDKFL